MAILDKIQAKIITKIADKVEGILGPELQPNWDMSKGIDVWAVASATISALVDNNEKAVLITSTNENGSGNMPISGLVIGKTYRLSVRARRGVGVKQRVHNVTWGTISTPFSLITTTSYADYVGDIVATAGNGNVNIRAALSGAIGDEVYISEVSIREVL